MKGQHLSCSHSLHSHRTLISPRHPAHRLLSRHQQPSCASDVRHSPWRTTQPAARLRAQLGSLHRSRPSRQCTAAAISRTTGFPGRRQLSRLLTRQYDDEILALFFPALLAVFLDPLMLLVDTGVRKMGAELRGYQATDLRLPCVAVCSYVS